MNDDDPRPLEVEILESMAELGVLDPGRVTPRDAQVRDIFNDLAIVRESNGFLDEGDIVIVCLCTDGTYNVSMLNPYLGTGARVWPVNVHPQNGRRE